MTDTQRIRQMRDAINQVRTAKRMLAEAQTTLKRLMDEATTPKPDALRRDGLAVTSHGVPSQ